MMAPRTLRTFMVNDCSHRIAPFHVDNGRRAFYIDIDAWADDA